MTRRALTFAVLLICSPLCILFATVPVSENLIFGESKGIIDEDPISEVLVERNLKFESISTADAGYFADWTIEDSKLFLTHFRGRQGGKDRGMKWLFPDSNGKVLAKWYSGKIHLFLGQPKIVKWDGLIVVPEKIIVFEIAEGFVKRAAAYEFPNNIEVVNEMMAGKLGRTFDLRNED